MSARQVEEPVGTDTTSDSSSKGSASAQIMGRIALSMLAVSVHALVNPASFLRPLCTLGAFGLLVFAGRKAHENLAPLPRLSITRLALFIASHVLLGSIAYRFGNELDSASRFFTLTANIVASSKLLVLFPTLFLFPFDRKFARRFAPELFASAIVLLTFIPGRHLQLIWPTYSKIIGSAITHICGALVPGTSYAEAANGVVVYGPAVVLHIDFTCSGISSIGLFHVLFGLMVAYEWNRIRKWRALMCYAIGTIAYLVVNVLRLVIVFLTGNLFVEMINLNWVLFALTFMLLIRVSYEWMIPLAVERGRVDLVVEPRTA